MERVPIAPVPRGPRGQAWSLSCSFPVERQERPVRKTPGSEHRPGCSTHQRCGLRKPFSFSDPQGFLLEMGAERQTQMDVCGTSASLDDKGGRQGRQAGQAAAV